MKIEHKSDYTERRRAAYPPIADYIDAQVKKASPDPVVRAEGLAQERVYFADCLALKAKYPKPVKP